MSNQELYVLCVALLCNQLGFWAVFFLVKRTLNESDSCDHIDSTFYLKHRGWIFFLMRVVPIIVMSIMLSNPLRCLVLLRTISLTSWMIIRRMHIRARGFAAFKAPLRALVIDICVIGLIKIISHIFNIIDR
jgi:hypothetical protein